MFWGLASGNLQNPINVLLDREGTTLKDLLLEEEILQEVQLPNQRLLDYLCKKDKLLLLLDYAIRQPSEGVVEGESFTISCAACEVICSEPIQLVDNIAAQPEFFAMLFEGSDSKRLAETANSTHVARIAAALMRTCGESFFAWLKDNQDVMEELIDKIEITEIAETIVRISGADEQVPIPLPLSEVAWISETAILPRILDRLDAEEDCGTAAEHAAEVLTAIARARRSPLSEALGSSANLQRLIRQAANATTNEVLIQVLNICIALVERMRLWMAAHERGLASAPMEADRSLESRAATILAPHIGHLLAHLSESQQDKCQETPYGLLQPPLGSGRLTVIALLAVLLRTGLPCVEKAVISGKLIQHCLSLFSSYPFNSILHHQVTSILASILEIGSDALIGYLFRDCQVLTWLMGLPLEVKPITNGKASKEDAILKPGYTGHITQIGNRLIAVAESRDLVTNFMEKQGGWQEFAAGRLAAANEAEDINSWECGRPSVSRATPVSQADDLSLGGELGVNGDYTGYTGFQSPLEYDAEDEEEGISEAGHTFAQQPEDEETFSSSPAFRNLVSELSEARSQAVASESPKSLHRRAQISTLLDGERKSVTGYARREADGADPEGSRPSPGEGPGVSSSWEDLALDSLAQKKTSLSASSGNDSASTPGSGTSILPPFAAVGTSPPTLGQSPLRNALQASILPEDIRVACSSEAVTLAGEPPSKDLAELRQPGTSDGLGLSASTHSPAKRNPSSDLDDHPYSGQFSMDTEDLRAETSDSVAAELDKLEMEELAASLSGSSAPGSEREEKTLVGTFTKLGVQDSQGKRTR